MRLSFFIGFTLLALIGMAVSGATLWATVAYFGLLPTIAMYTLAAVATGIQVYFTTTRMK